MDPSYHLLRASKTADYEDMIAALQYGADPNHKNDNGETCIMFLSEIITEFEPWERDEQHIQNRVIRCLELLLSKKVDIFSKNNFGQNAIYYAASSFGIVQLNWLLNNGNGEFWINGFDSFGNSCLHGRQIQVNDEDSLIPLNCNSMAILLAFGADMYQLSRSGKTVPTVPYLDQTDHYCWAVQDFHEKVHYLKENKCKAKDEAKVVSWASELERMKQVQILPNVSLKDLIFVSQCRYSMSEIINNQTLKQLHRNNNGDFTGMFSEFSIILNGKVKLAMKRQTMMDKLGEIINRLAQCQINEIDVFRKILKFLPDLQLREYCSHNFDQYFRRRD